MSLERLLIKYLDELTPVPTAHNIGLKTVLLSNSETTSSLTQISVNRMNPGESVDTHSHLTMDEHYLFLKGEGRFRIGEAEYKCRPGMFVLVPATVSHALSACSEIEFITIGVAL